MSVSVVEGIELRSGDLRLALRPDLGGCMAGLWHRDLPVLRSVEALQLLASRPSACYPLVPYSNRIGYRRFQWAGEAHTTAPNFGDSPHSVHGVGWLRPWQTLSSSEAHAQLRYVHAPDEHWPYAFEALQRFVLSADTLEVQLEFLNRHGASQPVGLGWHPYFPKRGHSRLRIDVTHRWQSGADQLPTRRVTHDGIDAAVSSLDFDHGFDGWSGPARITDECCSLELTSSLDRLVIYTPQDKDYYCVEPVSHASNALQAEDPLACGVRALAPGQTTGAWMKLRVSPP